MTSNGNLNKSLSRKARIAKELLRRQEATEKIIDFTTYTMPQYEVNWHHRLLASYLDRVAEGGLKRLMVCMPPQHGKSELVSRRFPAYALGRNPDLRVMGCSYAASLATDNSRKVQRIIDSNRYRLLFEHTRLSSKNVVASSLGHYKRTGDEFEIVGKSGSYLAAGVDGGIAGKGFDLGIVDDPFKNRKEADSPTIRKAVWAWWNNDFLTRKSADAAIILIMTRWHRDDVVGQELRERGDEWTVLSLPWIKGRDGASYDLRKEGEALWPEFKPASEEASVKKDLRAYHALYQQDPRSEGGAEWPDDCFGDCVWASSEWPHVGAKCVALDPSKGAQANKGDYSALVCAGITGDLIYVDCDMQRRNPSRIVVDLFAFCEKHRPDYIGLESNQFQSLFVDLIGGYAKERPEMWLSKWLTVGNGIIELDNRAKKEYRIRRLSQYVTARQFRYNNTAGCRLLVDQLRDFPNADHDDGPDALEMALRLPFEAEGVELPESVAGAVN